MPSNLSFWDVAILVVASYVSVMALVRLMRARRNQIVAHYQARVAEEQRLKREREAHERRQRARARQAEAFRVATEGAQQSHTPSA
jgi:hypothetical protein